MTTGLRPAARKVDPRLFVPVSEAAGLLGVSRSTLMRANQDAQFPLVKIRGTWRMPRRFIDDFYFAALRTKVIVLEEYAADWMSRNPLPEVA